MAPAGTASERILSTKGTLRIESDARGHVRLTADAEARNQVSKLLLAFPLARRDGPRSLILELGHFLANIAGLARWDAGPVEWAAPIAEMVKRTIADGGKLDALLRGAAPQPTVDQSELKRTSEWGWSGNLMSFQVDNLRALIGMEHGANFSVPGAGKTRVTLAAFAMMKAAGDVERMMVVAPKSAHGSWVDEASQVFPQPPTLEIVNSDRLPSTDIVLLNYERLPALRNLLADSLLAVPSLLVLDEAHRMKRGADGAYGSALLSLGPLARKRMILSGTPAPNGPEDLQSLLEFVWPGRGSRLVGDAQRQPGLLKPAFVRTTKSDLVLPEVIPTISHVTLPPLHRAIYDALLGQFATLPESERVDELGKVVVYLLMAATNPALLASGASRYEAIPFKVPPLRLPVGDRIRSLMSELPAHEMSPKLLRTVELVRENASAGKKTVVWSTFLRNAATLRELLGEHQPALVTGQTPDDERASEIRRFRSDNSCKVLISNPATLGEGISLHHECNDAIYLDRDFAAGRFLQSVDRIHRLGLKPSQVTNVTVLASTGTIDDLVEARLSDKIRFMDLILDDPSLLTLADLEENRESGPVVDVSDLDAVRTYLGWNGG